MKKQKQDCQYVSICPKFTAQCNPVVEAKHKFKNASFFFKITLEMKTTCGRIKSYELNCVKSFTTVRQLH